MVFHGAIDGTLKAYILYALQDKQHKPRELSEKLGVSLATIYKIKKGGFECLKRKTNESEPWTTAQDRYKNGKIIDPTSGKPSS